MPAAPAWKGSPTSVVQHPVQFEDPALLGPGSGTAGAGQPLGLGERVVGLHLVAHVDHEVKASRTNVSIAQHAPQVGFTAADREISA